MKNKCLGFVINAEHISLIHSALDRDYLTLINFTLKIKVLLGGIGPMPCAP